MLRATRFVLLAFGAAWLAGCSQGPVKLIPRQVLFGNPDKAGPQISPDGSKLAYLAPVDGVINVWVGPADKPAAAKPITRDTHRGIRGYFFAYTNEHVLYMQDKDGDENWRVYCVDLQTNQTRDLTPLEGVAAHIANVSPKSPDEILVALNDRDPRWHDIYRINIRTGDRKLVVQNDGFASFESDDDYNIRLASKPTQEGGSELFLRSGDSWTPFSQISQEDMLTTRTAGFDKSGRVLYMVDSRGRNTAALTSVNLNSGETTVLAENDRADINRTLRHPTERTIQAAGFNYLRQRWQFFDLKVAADFDVLRSLADGDVNIISRTLDDSQWIVALTVDKGPVRYYHYDRGKRRAKFLFTNRRAWENLPLARMHPTVIKSRDGLDLVSYLTLPVASDRDGNGRPAEPLPMVLLVHGGPWSRDAWGPNPYHQWLANRGYAVLSVNFRSSSGFGKAFLNAGDKQWSLKSHDDLIDAVQWAVDERIAHSEKVAIMGASYGGYATLIGLTLTPETFACGVDVCGPSSLITLLESAPPYWKPLLNVFTTRIGDHRTEEGRALLTKASPITYVDRICKPLLIGQGANDVRVTRAEADQIVAAMQAKDIPVTYLLYPDEGHGFVRPENDMSFSAVAESFLATNLGGRFEPIGDDFEGSSVEVLAGAEGVEGLSEVIGQSSGKTGQ